MPTAKPKSNRNAEIGAIKAAQRQLRLDDDMYRDLLEEWTGKRSAAKLTPPERRRVIDNFRKLGFKRRAGDNRLVVEASDTPQEKMIKGLWLALHRLGAVENPSIDALNAYTKRMTKIANIRWLPPRKANVLIEALKAWKKRVEASVETPPAA